MTKIRLLAGISQLAALLLFAALPLEAQAVKAYPYPVTVIQPDGNRLKIQVHGDEFFNYKTTENGSIVAMKSDGFLYYADYNNGALNISNTKAGSASGVVRTSKIPESVATSIAEQNRAKLMQNSVPRTATRAGVQTKPDRGLIILVGYSDLPFSKTKAQFSNMLNQSGYSDNGATGSAKDYYTDNSMSQYNPSFDVAGPYTLTNSMVYYGSKASGSTIGEHAYDMIVEACGLANADVDFSQYDSDGDGYVDNVFVYYAGTNPAEGGSSDNIWPHKSSVRGMVNTTFDGMKLDTYACSSELKGASGSNMAGIGTFCHEFGHVLGLSDFYATDGGNSPAFYQFLSLMDAGNYNNEGNTPPALTGLERQLLGWTTLVEITSADNSDMTLTPVSQNKSYIVNTKNDGEYFVIDNRQLSGWDAYINSYITTDPQMVHGMLIYHVDRSNNIVGGVTAASRWTNNTINNYPDHECAKVITPRGPVTRMNTYDLFLPGPAPVKDEYTLVGWGQLQTGITLSNITETASGDITFKVNVATESSLSGTVIDKMSVPVQGATITITPAANATNISPGNDNFKTLSFMAASQTITTGADGSYLLSNIAAGTYLVTCQKFGYADVSQVKSINDGGNKLDFILPSYDQQLYRGLQWYQSNVPYIMITPTQETRVMFASTWNTDDLTGQAGDYAGCKLTEVRAYIAQECDITVNVFTNNDNVLSKRYTATPSLGFTTIDVSAENVTVPAGKSLTVGFEFTKYSTAAEVGLMLLDNSRPVSGKNLFSVNGGVSWADYAPENGNFMIGAVLQNSVPQDGIINVWTVPGQRYADLTFYGPAASNSSWYIQVKNLATGQLSGITKVTSSEYMLEGLAPGTSYEVHSALTEADLSGSSYYTTKFTTRTITSPYAAIDNVKYNQAVGSKLKPRITNATSQPSSVVWKMNGSEVTGSEATLNTRGEQTITAEITYANGSKETITRVINVQ